MNTLQLQPRLKRLKLGGMLQTLELRLDQAHQEKLAYRRHQKPGTERGGTRPQPLRGPQTR